MQIICICLEIKTPIFIFEIINVFSSLSDINRANLYVQYYPKSK